MHSLLKLTTGALRTVGRSVGWALFVLSVLNAWPDIRNLPESYGFTWGQAVPERESVTNFLLGLSLLWIIGMDLRPSLRHWWGRQNENPLAISFTNAYSEMRDTEHNLVWVVTVRNTLRDQSIDGVEVHLLKIAKHAPVRGGHSPFNLPLIERASGTVSFSLAAGMSRDVLLFRQKVGGDGKRSLEVGPLESRDGQMPTYGVGLYRFDIALYGSGIPSVLESLAVGLDGTGGMMVGRWRDDLPWPFMSIKSTVTSLAV